MAWKFLQGDRKSSYYKVDSPYLQSIDWGGFHFVVKAASFFIFMLAAKNFG